MRKVFFLIAGMAAVATVAVVALWLGGRDAALTLIDPDCDDPSYVITGTTGVPGIPNIRETEVAGIRPDGTMDVVIRDEASWDADLSPDGERIVFVSGREGFHEECCGYSEQALYIADADGSDQRRLLELPQIDSPGGANSELPTKHDSAPAWSPDGDHIAFVRNADSPPSSVMVTTSEGEEPQEIYSSDRGIYDIAWSPDGERIAFLGGRNEGIWLVGRDGTDARVLAKGLGNLRSFDWSPDGRTFAFAAGIDVYTVTMEEPNPRRFVRRGSSATFSPDGRHIAYLMEGDDFETWIEVRAVGGGPAERLPFDPPKKRRLESISDWLDCS